MTAKEYLEKQLTQINAFLENGKKQQAQLAQELANLEANKAEAQQALDSLPKE